MKDEKQIEYLDEDFLGNKINIGDKVIFQAPDYRMFTIGKVITKAKKSCQIEYLNKWNFPTEGRKMICRQAYDQVIKQSEGEWIDKPTGAYGRMQSWCSACGKHSGIGGIESNRHKPFCPNCGAKMKGGE
jgi:hypothetical protein